MSRTTGYYKPTFDYPRKISWCHECNVPILSDDSFCPLCGHELTVMAVGKGEVRPVFEPEKEWYRDLLQSDGKDPDVWLPGGMAFYYRASIIVGGEKVFRVTFDEVYRKWKIKFFKKYQNKIPDVTGSNEKILVEANFQTLEAAELESLDFINQTFQEHHELPKGVSFSGGKDSAVVLHLVRQLNLETDVIYLNTTIEYPETERYVRKLQRAWGFNLIEVKPTRDFFDLCKELGPPSQYMRWCCKTTKFAPLNRLIEEKYDKTVLMVSGIRKNESHSRSEYSRIQRNVIIPKQLLMFPILDWNSLLVWLYMLWKKIPINQAYLSGRSRIGCWACPERRPKEFAKLKRTHPQLWERLKKMLTIYGKNNDITDITDWIEAGKWRLRASKYKKEYIKSKNLCSINDEVLYTIMNKDNMNNIIEFLKVFGKLERKKNLFYITNHSLECSIIKNNVRVIYNQPEARQNFEHQLKKALNCIGCGVCVGFCERRAIYIRNNFLHISDNCIHCLKCINNGLRKGCISLNYKTEQLLI